jgi:hypothetical protein
MKMVRGIGREEDFRAWRVGVHPTKVRTFWRTFYVLGFVF